MTDTRDPYTGERPVRFLSLGAGVQSSTLALMIAHGEVAPVAAAIFADTQWEPRAVYHWLDWLETKLPFPVHRVTAGSVRDAAVGGAAGRFAPIPFFLRDAKGQVGMGRRQCTNEYKLRPLVQKKRRLMGYAPRTRIPVGTCETLIGISTDEASRMRDSRERWNRNLYPLVDLRMNRADCLAWMRDHGYPAPPRSACIGCPFHSNDSWRTLRDTDAEAWRDAVAVDALIRNARPRLRGQQFMHRECLPLAAVDLSTPPEMGQGDLFGGECEGMCGV